MKKKKEQIRSDQNTNQIIRFRPFYFLHLYNIKTSKNPAKSLVIYAWMNRRFCRWTGKGSGYWLFGYCRFAFGFYLLYPSIHMLDCLLFIWILWIMDSSSSFILISNTNNNNNLCFLLPHVCTHTIPNTSCLHFQTMLDRFVSSQSIQALEKQPWLLLPTKE